MTALTWTGAKDARSGKEMPKPGGIDSVGPAGGDRGVPRPRQVGGLADVAAVRRPVRQRWRREQARQVVAQRARGGDRRQVGGPLGPALARHGAGDRDQGQRADEEDDRSSQHQQQRLPVFPPPSHEPDPGGQTRARGALK